MERESEASEAPAERVSRASQTRLYLETIISQMKDSRRLLRVAPSLCALCC